MKKQKKILSPENPCFCDCHRQGDTAHWCLDCLCGRHKFSGMKMPKENNRVKKLRV